MPMTETRFTNALRLRRLVLAVSWLTTLGLAPSLCWPQTTAPTGGEEVVKKPPTAQTHPNNPEMWNVEAMMDDAVLQITRRYNLNRAQEDYTRLLLRKRTLAFLEAHEKDVRELLKESIDFRSGNKQVTPEAYIKWALRAAPIYAAASKAILDGNEEWREILNDEQKKTHDADLSLMHTNFDQVARTMEEWKSGSTPVGRPNLPNDAQKEDFGPGKVGTNPRGEPSKGPGPSGPPVQVVRQALEDSWIAYVNLFIEAYRLDEKQTVAARDKIHKDIRDRASKYREKHKSDFEAADAERKVKPKAGASRKADLEKPLRELFMALDDRLHQLPDSKQRTAVNAERKKQLDAVYESLAGEPRDKRANGDAADSDNAKARHPSSQPAASRPATTQPSE